MLLYFLLEILTLIYLKVFNACVHECVYVWVCMCLCDASLWCWELISGSMEEQQVLPTTELSLQSLTSDFCIFNTPDLFSNFGKSN